MIIGAHLSTDVGSINDAVEKAKDLGLGALSICIGDPTSFSRPKNQVKIQKTFDIPLIVHAPFVFNMASTSKKDYARKVLKEEVRIAILSGAQIIVIHPGSATDCDRDTAVSNIRDVLLSLPTGITICVETMAGLGNQMGSTIKEMGNILVNMPNHIGMCIDTCHIHDAGYSIGKSDDYFKEVEMVIGLERIKHVHINGSLNALGSKKDRHANIRDENNMIPLLDIRKFIRNPCLKDVPMVIETYRNDIELLDDLSALEKF